MDQKQAQSIYLKIYEASSRTLKDISEVELLSPQQTDLYRTKLTALYALLSEELAQLEKKKPLAWLQIKQDHLSTGEKPLSDKMADTMYDCTDEGQRRVELKFHLKASEKMISALSARMRRLETEARQEGYQV